MRRARRQAWHVPVGPAEGSPPLGLGRAAPPADVLADGVPKLATARLTDEDAARLEALAAQVDVVVGQPRPDRASAVVRHNSDFHREVARISGNRRLERTIGGLLDELDRVMHMLAYDPSLMTLVDQHPALVRVMREGDPAAPASRASSSSTTTRSCASWPSVARPE